MFDGPIRGGTRGGQGEFKWSDVSADKDRENYLGHSINAPTGRWQKNKDVHWYNRDLDNSEAERLEEIRKIKEAEEDALAVALGFKPAVRPVPGAEAGSSAVEGGEKPRSLEDPSILADKEEKRRRKEERRKRKEEKRERKELKRLLRLREGSARGDDRRLANKNGDDEYDALRGRSARSRSRSRSPRGLNWRTSGKSRSRSPDHDGYRPRGAREMERDRYDRGIRERRSRYDAPDYDRSRGVDRL
ncbi:kinase phosphorylation protein-domain-containing protein [Gautieria morchelliformis]|nr:kinase phosphorylation protein-domain-containing protein [Gautieria morchelliformis]